MGYLVGNRCVDSVSEANDFVFSTITPRLTPGSVSYEGYFTYSGGAWQQCRSQVSSTGARSGTYCLPTSSLAYQSCSAVGYVSDGATLGWAVALVLVLAWGSVKLAGVLR